MAAPTNTPTPTPGAYPPGYTSYSSYSPYSNPYGSSPMSYAQESSAAGLGGGLNSTTNISQLNSAGQLLQQLMQNPNSINSMMGNSNTQQATSPQNANGPAQGNDPTQSVLGMTAYYNSLNNQKATQ